MSEPRSHSQDKQNKLDQIINVSAELMHEHAKSCYIWIFIRI